MLINAGCARGHEVANIKTRYPHIPGRSILQDLPETTKQALDVDSMEVMEHDFFIPQPIKGEPDLEDCVNVLQTNNGYLGARAYYLRNILHDWSDLEFQQILSQIKLAMKSGYSIILLKELVLPDKGMSLTAAQIEDREDLDEGSGGRKYHRAGLGVGAGCC